MTDTGNHILDEFLHSPIEVIAALTVIVGATLASFGKTREFLLNTWRRLRLKPAIPRETLRIVQDTRTSFSGPARRGETPLTQVNFDGHVTNISDKPVRILGVDIVKPAATADMAVISNNHDGRRPQVLSPGECAELRVCLFVEPPIADNDKPWRCSLIFIDQYGNKHKVKNCVFSPLPKPAKPAEFQEPQEYSYEIADPIEKEIVAVLNAELAPYRVCGRSCGGLGSVHIVYRGHAFPGVGSDSWTPNSPLNQIIVADPESASLRSDNLDALVGFYKTLSDDDQARFVAALLDRLDSTRGYLAVSYFIVAVLWRIGFLGDALRKARQSLPAHEQRVFGLSNVLMLLNGLLKYLYPEFTSEMLDEIERLIHGLDEHCFFISNRVAAIRASRLPRTPEAVG